ncbi:MAG TPA: YkgJ family cysteine cluster protein [Bacillota bacterium]|nr:YkgJ family cysteine cluster protein [Bacillota bacterium]
MSKNLKLPNIEATTEPPDLPAGCFSSWLRRTRIGLIKEREIDVACGACNACCKSSYFIHIRPEETKTLARIPKQILFPAPGLPKGNMVLGYDEKGCCPMLINDKCSIYEHRPQTCRNYDCRIFTAAGIAAGDDKDLITQQIRRWKFSYPTKRDLNLHLAVQAAAKFLRDRADCFPGGAPPSNSSQLALIALQVYEVLLKYNEASGETGLSDIEVAKAIMEANEKFKARRDG